MEIKPKQITWDQIPKGWIVEPKYDGECNKLIIKNGKARLERFEGRDKTEFYPEIIAYANRELHETTPKREPDFLFGRKDLGDKFYESLKDKAERIPLTADLFHTLPDMVLVGEVCVLMDKFKASFPHIQLRMNTQNKVKQKLAMKDYLATFVAFDIEEIEGGTLEKMSYGERRNLLRTEELTYIEPYHRSHQRRIIYAPELNTDEDWKAFVKKNEMEGIVCKNPDAVSEWVKLKNWDEDEFKIVGTELTDEGKARGWHISKLRLEDTKGNHVDKGMQFDCKYINYPQTEVAKKLVIGKTAIIKYMKMRGRDGQYLAPRHPSLVTILEEEALLKSK